MKIKTKLQIKSPEREVPGLDFSDSVERPISFFSRIWISDFSGLLVEVWPSVDPSWIACLSQLSLRTAPIEEMKGKLAFVLRLLLSLF